jgi:hypothetical protein
MRTFITIVLVLIFGITTKSQNNFLGDTLIKTISVFDNDTIYKYVNFDGEFNELPRPRTAKGQIPEGLVYNYKPDSLIINYTKEIFNSKEIDELIESKCSVQCISTSSGKVESVSFMFAEREPEICFNKFVSLSQKIKEKLTIETEFNMEIEEGGYVLSTNPLYVELKRELSF